MNCWYDQASANERRIYDILWPYLCWQTALTIWDQWYYMSWLTQRHMREGHFIFIFITSKTFVCISICIDPDLYSIWGWTHFLLLVLSIKKRHQPPTTLEMTKSFHPKEYRNRLFLQVRWKVMLVSPISNFWLYLTQW